MLPKHDDFWIWGVNANNILIYNDSSELHKPCVSLVKYNIGIACFQKIKINIFKAGIRKKINNIFRQHFSTFKTSFSTTSTQIPTLWKPGGTVMVFLGELSHRITHTKNNQLGF